MASTLEQIMAELDSSGGYANDRGLLNQQLSALPAQGEAEIKGLDAKLTQANDNILQGARSRGLGFSGIPIAEQAQYAATEYAPAVARVKQQQEASRMGILQSLNALERDRRGQAQSIFDTTRNFNEQVRQFNEQQAFARQQFEAQQRAAARASSGGSGATAGSYLSGLGGGQAAAPQQAAQKQSGPSAADQAIYSRAKSLQAIAKQGDAKMVQSLLKRLDGGNAQDKSVAATFRQMIGGGY